MALGGCAICGKNLKIQNGHHFWGGENTEDECERTVGVTVAGARSSGAPVLLKNRFQPLQMFMSDDYNEPQSEETLQGSNNDKHSLSNAVNAKSIQSNVKPLLASQENDILAGKKKLGLWQGE